MKRLIIENWKLYDKQLDYFEEIIANKQINVFFQNTTEKIIILAEEDKLNILKLEFSNNAIVSIIE